MKISKSPLKKLEIDSIELPSSKSISNRLLIMQAIAGNSFEITNLSQADDTKVLLEALKSNSSPIDVGMAGTAFRFLTAFYAVKNLEVELTGHLRMLERPIAPLVDVLNTLGANIKYLKKDGFPPLQIKKGNISSKSTISIDSSISSQFISALLLIAPYLKNGLEISLKNEIVSSPYIKMTARLMEQMGAKIQWKNEIIKINHGSYFSLNSIQVEADWSSAAFFYQYFCCSRMDTISIKGLAKDSIQGDAACVGLFEKLGVRTEFTQSGIVLHRTAILIDSLEIDLEKFPDLIPSFAISAAMILDNVIISGVQTLRIKESNRVFALQEELAKVNIEVKDLGLKVISLQQKGPLPRSANFKVHNDHRMAMCFAILGDLLEKIEIDDSDVVSKSFPNFWKEYKKLGFSLKD